MILKTLAMHQLEYMLSSTLQQLTFDPFLLIHERKFILENLIFFLVL